MQGTGEVKSTFEHTITALHLQRLEAEDDGRDVLASRFHI